MSHLMSDKIFTHLMRKAILHKIETGSVEKFDDKLLQEMKRRYESMSLWEGDYRSGEETYGYLDQEQIALVFRYISDRWYCSYRLKWLIDGLEQGKF